MTRKKITIALAGNPNSGKTTVFNNLTGARQHVGNWPGVTVEKKEGSCTFKGYSIKVVDLPGVYSLTAYSLDEVIARDYVIDEKPDVVVDVVDASNLERNLYLAVQLLEMEVKLVIALNMMDVAESREHRINVRELSRLLGVPVEGVRLVGGSGLARGSVVPARTLTRLLALAAGRERPELRWMLTGLPVAGASGTLADRFDGSGQSAALGIVRAKTGTLTGVNSLAGIVVDSDGRLLAFAVMADRTGGSRAARAALDAFAAALAGCGSVAPAAGCCASGCPPGAPGPYGGRHGIGMHRPHRPARRLGALGPDRRRPGSSRPPGDPGAGRAGRR